jgi:hypothetical protein
MPQRLVAWLDRLPGGRGAHLAPGVRLHRDSDALICR